jgi:hypothetical protein
MPAYWWLYNMYALARNSWKFRNRDKRKIKTQHIEFEPLAPDTVEEIWQAVRLLEIWTARAAMRQSGEMASSIGNEELALLGRNLLSGNKERMSKLEVLGENMENSRRKVVILKPEQAYQAYHDMLHYYAVFNLLSHLRDNPGSTFTQMCRVLQGSRPKKWVNLGGQIMLQDDLDTLRSDIGSGKMKAWKEIHDRYDFLWEKYAADKQQHAFSTLCELYGKASLDLNDWQFALDKTLLIQQYICDQVYVSRRKDFDNPFKKNTFRNEAEMTATIGRVEDNSFILQIREETEEIRKIVEEVRQR